MLRVINLSFSYHDKQIFRDLNLSFSEPEIIAIIGDNGVGKTTLLRLISGELIPDSGRIITKGSIGYLCQTQPDLTDKSGGERTKIKLVELLRERHDILLLDEPTNNLDVDNLDWLEKSLLSYRGLILLVSHDRNFIDRVADKVLDLPDGKIYAGNYSAYETRQAQSQREQASKYAEYNKTRQKLAQHQKVIQDRARKTNHRSYNKLHDESKLNFNGKRTAAQNSTGKILQATESKIAQLGVVQKPKFRKIYHAKIASNSLHDKRLLLVDNLAKSYSDKTVFRDLSFEVCTGERVRILGNNGAGKSTLFKIITGQLSPDAGVVRVADNLKISYISQDIDGLNGEKSFLEECKDLAESKVYQAAATMDFTPAEIRKPMQQLSRGQLTKLAILKLILMPVDLVILDEPTNHLDIRARQNIEDALAGYSGAILIATHDAYFAQKLQIDKEITLGQ